jgi:hypothetical protein
VNEAVGVDNAAIGQGDPVRALPSRMVLLGSALLVQGSSPFEGMLVWAREFTIAVVVKTLNYSDTLPWPFW